MTLNELDAALAAPHIGPVTLEIASNGKAYVTVYFRQPDGQFKPENQWAASTAEGLAQIFDRMKGAPPAAAPAPAADLSGLLV